MVSSPLTKSLVTAPPSTDHEPYGFLDLPGEIRNKIYALLLIAPTIMSQSLVTATEQETITRSTLPTGSISACQ